MQFQERLFSCGPAAVRAALYVLGHNNISEATLRRRAGTTPEGTNEQGLMRAIRSFNHKPKEYQSESRRASWSWLKTCLSKGKPVLLCVDQWDHWVAAVGTLGGKVLIFDPGIPPGRRKKYSGLEIYNEQELHPRWGYEDEDTDKTIFYGVSITY